MLAHFLSCLVNKWCATTTGPDWWLCSQPTVVHPHASVQVLLRPLGCRDLLAKTLRVGPLDDLFLWNSPVDKDNVQTQRNGERPQLFQSTYQLCKLFVNDVFDCDVVYLVMTAQPLRNCGFAHCWWSDQADPDWLKENIWLRLLKYLLLRQRHTNKWKFFHFDALLIKQTRKLVVLILWMGCKGPCDLAETSCSELDRTLHGQHVGKCWQLITQN